MENFISKMIEQVKDLEEADKKLEETIATLEKELPKKKTGQKKEDTKKADR